MVDGMALASMEDLDVRDEVMKPLNKYCHIPGCAVINLAPFTPNKLVAHNFIHTRGISLYDESPLRSWVYDLKKLVIVLMVLLPYGSLLKKTCARN